MASVVDAPRGGCADEAATDNRGRGAEGRLRDRLRPPAQGDTVPGTPGRASGSSRHGGSSHDPLEIDDHDVAGPSPHQLRPSGRAAGRPRRLVLDHHRLGIVGLGVGLAVEMRCIRASSSAPSHFATTTVATPLPIRLVSARASDMNRSTPRISAMLATGTVPSEASVAASTMKPEPVTPAAPFEVSSRMAIRPSCCAQRQVGVGRLGQEHRRHGQVDAGAVEVERVAGRDHQADHGLLAAQILHLGQHARQHRFRGDWCRARSAAPP